LSLNNEQNVDSSDEEIQDEAVARRTISDLDVMATYKVLIDLLNYLVSMDLLQLLVALRIQV